MRAIRCQVCKKAVLGTSPRKRCHTCKRLVRDCCLGRTERVREASSVKVGPVYFCVDCAK